MFGLLWQLQMLSKSNEMSQYDRDEVFIFYEYRLNLELTDTIHHQ